MKKTILPIMILAFVAPAAFAITGREIMEKNDKLPSSSASIQESLLVIQKGKAVEKKEFTSVSKKYGKNTRTKITFTSPTRMGFLIYDEAGKDSTQWIKLTSGKVRQIASSDKGKEWMNSHFYNEDIGDKDIDTYTYKLIGEGKSGEFEIYKVSAVKKVGDKVYSQGIFYMDKKDFIPRQIDLYENGRHTKTLYFEKYEKISGIWTPRKLKMTRTDGKGTSLLYIKLVKHNQSVNDAELKKENF